MPNEEKMSDQEELTTKSSFDKHLKAVKEHIIKIPEQEELAKKLLKMDNEMFKIVKEVMINGPIKFVRAPVFDHTFFNTNIIEKLNNTQLNYMLSLLLHEYSKRKLPKEDILEELKELMEE